MNAIHGWPLEIRPAGQVSGLLPGGFTCDQWRATAGDPSARWALALRYDAVVHPQGLFSVARTAAQLAGDIDRLCVAAQYVPPASQNQMYPVVYDQPVLTAAQFLKDRNWTCAAFEALPMASKRAEVYTYLRGKGFSDRYVILNTTAWINAIGAECLKQVVSLQRGKIYSIVPAGQAATPDPIGTLLFGLIFAGALGFAAGGAVTHFAMRR